MQPHPPPGLAPLHPRRPLFSPLCLPRSKLGDLLTLDSQPEGSNHALVPLCRVLLRGRIPRQHPAPSRQRDLGTCLPEPLRISTGGRLVLLDGQCLMGPLQPCRRLPARLPCRQLQSAQDPACARPRGGYPAHVAHACPRIRTVPRGTVSLQIPGPCLPRCQLESPLGRHGQKVVNSSHPPPVL